MNPSQAAGANSRAGPAGFLESRTATVPDHGPEPGRAVSTQLFIPVLRLLRSHRTSRSEVLEGTYRGDADNGGASLRAVTYPGDVVQRVLGRKGVEPKGVEGLRIGLEVFFPFEVEATRQVVENNHIQISCVRK